MSDIEAYLLEQDEVVNVSVTIGGSPLRYYLASTSFGPKANFGNLLIEVKKKEQSPVVEERLNTYVRENYPDMLIFFVQVVSGGGGRHRDRIYRGER